MDAVVGDTGAARLVEPDTSAVFDLSAAVREEVVGNEMATIYVRRIGRCVTCVPWPDTICVQAKASYIFNPVARDGVIYVRLLKP